MRTGGRDAEGYRTYQLTTRVKSTDIKDGPTTVMRTPGLYRPGATWFLGNDLDIWAWCRPDMTIKPASEYAEGRSVTQWDVVQTFSSRPVLPEFQRCNNTEISDPLLEPQKISGSFVSYNVLGQQDRFGQPIESSSHEPFPGQENEWENNRLTVEISQNVPQLQLDLLSYVQNNPLNNDFMWGVIPRGVKFTCTGFERLYYGSCYVYYNRKFRFDVNVVLDPMTGNLVSGWDRDLTDWGTKFLWGHWDTDVTSPTHGTWINDNIGGSPPDPTNPTHFKKAVDMDGQALSGPLDGHGNPANNVIYTTRGPRLMSLVEGTEHDAYDTIDPQRWCRLISDPTKTATTYEGYTTKYPRGILRSYSGFTWLQTNPKGTTAVPGGVNNDWADMTSGVDRGNYADLVKNNGFLAIHKGDWVTIESQSVSGLGKIHVEKYGESDLLTLLNLPLYF
jgi:hypothetical protein